MASRIDGRRINHLRTEVAKLHRFHIAQFVDDVSIADDTRVGSHKSIHVCPNFQYFCLKSSRNDRSGIIRATSPKVSNLTTILVARNEARHESHLRKFIERSLHQLSGQVRIENMTGVFLFSLDECTRIIPYGTFDEICHDDGRKAFAIAHDGSRCLWRKVTNQIDTLEDILQLAQKFIHLVEQDATCLACRDDGIYHLDVTVQYITVFLLVCGIATCGHFRSLNQLVCNATQGRNYHDDRFFYGLNYLFYT